jgi:hypothetical protein
MMDEVVACRPVRDLAREPIAPFTRAAIHLHHVRLDMMGEVIGSVTLERHIHRTFGRGVVAGFLVREGPDALAAVIAEQVG